MGLEKESDPRESRKQSKPANFTKDQFDRKLSEDTKMSKVQIKNPKDINKYVQRKKKRGHARKKTMFTTSNYDLAKSFDATQDSANKKLKEKKITTSICVV